MSKRRRRAEYYELKKILVDGRWLNAKVYASKEKKDQLEDYQFRRRAMRMRGKARPFEGQVYEVSILRECFNQSGKGGFLMRVVDYEVKGVFYRRLEKREFYHKEDKKMLGKNKGFTKEDCEWIRDNMDLILKSFDS